MIKGRRSWSETSKRMRNGTHMGQEASGYLYRTYNELCLTTYM